jgi:hypothetical protein
MDGPRPVLPCPAGFPGRDERHENSRYELVAVRCIIEKCISNSVPAAGRTSPARRLSIFKVKMP